MLSTPPDTLIITPLNNTQSESLHSLFSCIEHQPWSLLFDTASQQHSNGRFNIMLWEPAIKITAKDGTTTIEYSDEGRFEQHQGEPLSAVKDLVAQYFADVDIKSELPAVLTAQLPFLAGAAGLCGYDLGRYYERLPATAANELNCPDLAIGIYFRSLIEDTHTGVIYECRMGNSAPLNVEDIKRCKRASTPFNLTSQWHSNLSQQQYIDALNQIDNYLRAGDCYQVNMAQRFSAQYHGSEWQAFNALSKANEAPFSAFMRLPESCILSISPERFLAVKNGQVETKPIKGTRPRFTDPTQDEQSAADLLNAEKDRAENLMIVDLLRNDLSKHCQPGSVDVPQLFALESYAAVHHMVSTVTGRLTPDHSPLDLLAGAFPGGSITGAPKVRAMEIIDELEPHRRHIYCGSIMYMGLRQDMDSSILIRSLLCEDDQIYCWAGGGIVLDSDPHAEYQETLDKVSRILPLLEKLN